MAEEIHTTEDVLQMLDAFLRDEGTFWNGFYGDRTREIPFFVDRPDENLVAYFEEERLEPARVLELGCGAGRNALFLAERGCRVHAVDISREALDWARERMEQRGLEVRFQLADVFSLAVEAGSYDLVYDCGCLHHIPPHRRPGYLDMVERALKPGGHFGLVCFRPEGGSDLSDWEVYRKGGMAGGLGFSEARLRSVLDTRFDILELRQMKEAEPEGDWFGKSFCWVALTRKPAQ